jgi:hypothetical protein
MARQAKFGEGVVDAVGQVGDRVNQGSVKVEEDGFDLWHFDKSAFSQ